MRDPTPPTYDELLAEYKAASTAPQEGQTVAEWASEWSIPVSKARTLILYALRSGTMVSSNGYRETPLRPGWRCHVTLHRFSPSAKPAGMRSARNATSANGAKRASARRS